MAELLQIGRVRVELRGDALQLRQPHVQLVLFQNLNVKGLKFITLRPELCSRIAKIVREAAKRG